MSSGLHQFSAHAWLSISARDVHARLQSEQADGRDRLRPLRLREISDLAFLKAEQRLCGCWREDTLGDAGAAIRRAPLPVHRDRHRKLEVRVVLQRTIERDIRAVCAIETAVTGAWPSVASADWLARISQCAPTARIIDGGRFHPDNFSGPLSLWSPDCSRPNCYAHSRGL